MEQDIAAQVVGLGGASDFSLLSLFMRADIVVKFVIILLIASSIFSWALIFDKFKLGFKKSANKISVGFREIIIKKEIDDKKLDEIEEFLISSDVGVEASAKIKQIISERKIDPKSDPIMEINKL